MLILGLIVGPTIGLLSGDLLGRFGGQSLWRSGLAVLLFLVFILFAPFFTIELKVGLAVGTLLGLLLSATPLAATQTETRET